MSETNEELLEIHRRLKADAEYRAKFMGELTGNRIKKRQHWKEGTISSYYRESYARDIQPILDRMIETQQDVNYRYKDFSHIRRNTLCNMIQNSFMWLRDEEKTLHDGKVFATPEEKREAMPYTHLWDDVQITKTQTAVQIRFINRKVDLRGKAKFVEEPTTKGTDGYQTRVTDFIENAPEGKVLEIKNMQLTDGEVEDLQFSLIGLDGIMHKITNDKIKIIKVKA